VLGSDRAGVSVVFKMACKRGNASQIGGWYQFTASYQKNSSDFLSATSRCGIYRNAFQRIQGFFWERHV